MTREPTVLDRLEAVLSEKVLEGSDRDLPSDAPLGGEGVGLDSLALVQFLTGVEQAFGTEVPMEVWSDIAQLSLADCALALERLPAR